jgi:hypothetical protein
MSAHRITNCEVRDNKAQHPDTAPGSHPFCKPHNFGTFRLGREGDQTTREWSNTAMKKARRFYFETSVDYWVLWTFPSSGILETRKHDVSETGSVSVLR